MTYGQTQSAHMYVVEALCLSPLCQRTAHTGDEASPTPRAEATPTSEQAESASQRRHRRRRERARALEVSVRPTTLTPGYSHAGSSDGYAGDGDYDAETSRVDHDEDGGGQFAVVEASATAAGVVGVSGVVIDAEEVFSGSCPLLPVLTFSSSIEESVYVAEADTPTTTVNFIAPGDLGQGEGEGGDLTPSAMSESNYYVPFTGGVTTSVSNVSNFDDDSGEESGDGVNVTAVITSLDLGGPCVDCVETIRDTEQSTVATICTEPATYSTVATNTRSFGKSNASTSPPRL